MKQPLHRGAPERGTAGETFKQDDARRIQIRRRPHLGVEQPALLGRQVLERAHREVLEGGIQQIIGGQPEADQRGLLQGKRVDDEIGRLDVPVEHAARVHLPQRGQQAAPQGEGLGDAEVLARQALLQGDAGDIGHHQVGELVLHSAVEQGTQVGAVDLPEQGDLVRQPLEHAHRQAPGGRHPHDDRLAGALVHALPGGELAPALEQVLSPEPAADEQRARRGPPTSSAYSRRLGAWRSRVDAHETSCFRAMVRSRAICGWGQATGPHWARQPTPRPGVTRATRAGAWPRGCRGASASSR